MNTVLDLCCGIGWSIAYVAAVILGVKRRTWCIPKLSICLNFSWEFWVVVNRLLNGNAFNQAFFIQLAWLLLDIGIVTEWLLFDRGAPARRRNNIAMFLVIMAVMYALAYKAGEWGFSVFFVNLVMSAEFIYRTDRDVRNWTSPLIAVAKLIGTLAATILNGLIIWNPLTLWLGGVCFLLDGYYLVMLMNREKRKG